MPPTNRASRDAALTELQRLHAAILASRASRGAGPAAAARVEAEAPSTETLAAQELTRRLQREAEAVEPPAPPSRRGRWLALAAAVIVAGVWTAFTLTQRPEVVTEASPTSPKTAPPAATPDRPVTVAPIEASTAPAKPIQLRLETIRPVWLRVTVDGVRTLERELPAGETLTFGGDREVLVRSGDAGGVRAAVNNVDRGPLGRDGWPLTVSVTTEGIAPRTPTRPEP